MRILLALVSAASLVSAQAASSDLRSPAELDAEGWVLLDGAIAQAGSAIVTLTDLDRFLTGRLGPGATESEAQQAAPIALRTLETIRLETQAGEDLGIARQEIERIIQANLDDRRQTAGVQGFLDYLNEEGLDPREAVKSQSGELYRILWTREQLGVYSTTGRRVRRDSFLRPGVLRTFYRENPDLLGEPPRVRFQRIALGARAPDGLESARELALELIARLQAGESFDAILLEYSEEPALRSIEDWQDASLLAQQNPELGRFAREAVIGSVYSEPLPAFPTAAPGEGPPQQLGWFVYRLNDRLAGISPPFASRETQEDLREELTRRWRNNVLGRERERLSRSAFGWRHPLFGGAAEPSPPAAGPPAPNGP